MLKVSIKYPWIPKKHSTRLDQRITIQPAHILEIFQTRKQFHNFSLEDFLDYFQRSTSVDFLLNRSDGKVPLLLRGTFFFSDKRRSLHEFVSVASRVTTAINLTGLQDKKIFNTISLFVV